MPPSEERMLVACWWLWLSQTYGVGPVSGHRRARAEFHVSLPSSFGAPSPDPVCGPVSVSGAVALLLMWT